MLQTGEAAPPFTLTDATGRQVSLADLAGKDVILYFYPKDDTPGCTKEACGFRDAWDGPSGSRCGCPRRLARQRRLTRALRREVPAARSRCSPTPTSKVMEAYGAYGEKTSYGRKTVGRDPLDRLDRTRRPGSPALGPDFGRRGAPRPGSGRPRATER